MPGDIPNGASERNDTQKLGEVARRAYTLAHRTLGHQADAEDVAQEVLVRLLKHRRRLESGRNIQGWIYRVTVNCCNDVLRQRQRQSELDVDELQAPAQSVEVHDLATLLQRLSPRERTAVALVFGQGLTCREVVSEPGDDGREFFIVLTFDVSDTAFEHQSREAPFTVIDDWALTD